MISYKAIRLPIGLIFLGLSASLLTQSSEQPSYFKKYFCDCVDLWKASFRNRKAISTLVPSSPWLVNEVSKHVSEKEPMDILEVGAGTGIVTQEIIRRKHLKATFDVIERDTILCQILNKKFINQSENQMRIYESSVEEWQPEITKEGMSKKYDVIISTVPFTQLPINTVKAILEKYDQLLKPNGCISYITFLGSETLGKWLLNKKERTIFKQKLQILIRWRKRFALTKKMVLVNFPPALVYHLKKQRVPQVCTTMQKSQANKVYCAQEQK